MHLVRMEKAIVDERDFGAWAKLKKQKGLQWKSDYIPTDLTIITLVSETHTSLLGVVKSELTVDSDRLCPTVLYLFYHEQMCWFLKPPFSHWWRWWHLPYRTIINMTNCPKCPGHSRLCYLEISKKTNKQKTKTKMEYDLQGISGEIIGER